MNLVDAALCILREMATFAAAGVSDSGGWHAARRPLRPLGTAFSFLTRLPVRDGADRRGGARPLDPFFPAGRRRAGRRAGGAERLLRGHLPAGLIAVGLVALSALLTGGLHLDGLADTFDALGGGRGDRARMLEIMRDSRIGAHGAGALTLLLAAKVLAVTRRHPARRALAAAGRSPCWPAGR